MPKNEDHDLRETLNHLAPLDEVPHDISRRFDETLELLIHEHEKSKKKPSQRFQFSAFSIAASFFVVVAFGAAITLNSSSEVSVVAQSRSSNEKPNPSVTVDQNLYSSESTSSPKVSEAPILILNSGQNYELISSKADIGVALENSLRKPSNLPSGLRKCLVNLGLIDSLNAVDMGSYKGGTITAAWSPVSEKSWNVFLIDVKCTVVDKLILN